MKKILLQLNINPDEPVYLQIIRAYKILLAKGAIDNGDEFPSRRELAMHLVINPNTVQRAYKELEDVGLLTTESNLKSVAVVNADIIADTRSALIDSYSQKYLGSMRALNIDLDTAIQLLKETKHENS